ncbi:hypothetical protein A1359_20315 [Methylomonas lenta]|uniref:Copper oxidase n=1 Tax=Methylomonas lenta TaxID=980561 RepID=A0A177NTH1_9GAMM|nr:hypothetical protein [Methylomonas lenta]OAI20834.1 hypothetical protein A1359_20315 [Methylomonas lenta]
MYEDELPLTSLKKIKLSNNQDITIEIQKCRARLKSGVDPAQPNVWCYRTYPATTAVLNNYLGPILNVQQGQPCKINWVNTLSADMSGDKQELPPINGPSSRPGMEGMMMNAPVGVVTHLHGARIKHFSDGWPLDPIGFVNNPHGYPENRQLPYPNDQRATMLWYHDHAMDNTSPNVHAGLAGLYFIRDESDTDIFDLLGGKYEIPLVLQDHVLTADATAFDYDAGLPASDPADQTTKRPEFLGDKIFVNGRVHPHCHLERRVYRLRLLNGSNARTYALALQNPDDSSWHTDRLTVIGTDGGLMTKSVHLAKDGYLVIAPSERRDILLDLTGLKNISTLRLVNLAIASLFRNDSVEGIFTYSLPRDGSPDDGSNSVLPKNSRTAANFALSQANVLEFRLLFLFDRHKHSDLYEDVDEVLANYACGDGFTYNRNLNTLQACMPVARNRLVLLMNNALQDPPVLPDINWGHVQMWEMADGVGSSNWDFPFAVDLTSSNPTAGSPVASQQYKIARSTFFDPGMMPMPPVPGHYPPLAQPTIRAKAGSYERWYVANITNQPLGSADPLAVPDMHPFHVHLVNFIVTRRWRQKSGWTLRIAKQKYI